MNENAEGAASSNEPGDAVRYLAPELIKGTNALVMTGSDTFSFGMLMLECITEKAPFSDLTEDSAVFGARIAGVLHPPRPDGLDPKSCVPDLLWELMLRCWFTDCKGRPTMEQVHKFLSQ